MKPLFDQAFWSDPDIEAKPPETKLAAAWLITNSRTSMLGVCGASPARFQFETGLPIEALDETIKALPRAFQRFGDNVFIKNYVRHQFGTGERLTRNNFFKALTSLFLSIKDEELQKAILSEYPDFNEALTKGFKGLPKPKERKGKEGKGKDIPAPPEILTSIDGFSEKWNFFIQHRSEIRKPLTPLAAGGILKTLSERPTEAVFALDTAIRRSWQGFEWAWMDKELQNGQRTQTPPRLPTSSELHER